MRVAIFFDGKNFYEGMEHTLSAERRFLNYRSLALWLVQRVGGTELAGAHYYTGVPAQLDPDAPEYASLRGLQTFLTNLEYEEGFFVYTFPRVKRSSKCRECGNLFSHLEEKEVDTTMVADMVRLAANDAFDRMILASGDADLSPAVEAIRRWGKAVYIASWGEEALSARLRKAAYGHIDLLKECPNSILGWGDSSKEVAELSDSFLDRVLQEVERGQKYFEKGDGYLGRGYFLYKWNGQGLSSDPVLREEALDQLIKEGHVKEVEQSPGEMSLCLAESTGKSPSIRGIDE